MSRCNICNHKDLLAIDNDLDEGELTNVEIAKKYNLTGMNVGRHKSHMRRDIPEVANILLNKSVDKGDNASAIRTLEFIERQKSLDVKGDCNTCALKHEEEVRQRNFGMGNSLWGDDGRKLDDTSPLPERIENDILKAYSQLLSEISIEPELYELFTEWIDSLPANHPGKMTVQKRQLRMKEHIEINRENFKEFLK